MKTQTTTLACLSLPSMGAMMALLELYGHYELCFLFFCVYSHDRKINILSSFANIIRSFYFNAVCKLIWWPSVYAYCWKLCQQIITWEDFKTWIQWYHCYIKNPHIGTLIGSRSLWILDVSGHYYLPFSIKNSRHIFVQCLIRLVSIFLG